MHFRTISLVDTFANYETDRAVNLELDASEEFRKEVYPRLISRLFHNLVCFYSTTYRS